MADFSTGLCSCCSDCGVCLYTLFCPTCAMANNWAQSRNEDCNLCHYCAFSCPIWTRANIRTLLGQVDKKYTQDCCVYFWCPHCAICQDARELKILRTAKTMHNQKKAGGHHHHSHDKETPTSPMAQNNNDNCQPPPVGQPPVSPYGPPQVSPYGPQPVSPYGPQPVSPYGQPPVAPYQPPPQYNQNPYPNYQYPQNSDPK